MKVFRLRCKILRIAFAFNPNRKEKTRVRENEQGNIKEEQELDKIWASHPLHKIGLHTSYANLKITRTQKEI